MEALNVAKELRRSHDVSRHGDMPTCEHLEGQVDLKRST
jgi:hypothetical protein